MQYSLTLKIITHERTALNYGGVLHASFLTSISLSIVYCLRDGAEKSSNRSVLNVNMVNIISLLY